MGIWIAIVWNVESHFLACSFIVIMLWNKWKGGYKGKENSTTKYYWLSFVLFLLSVTSHIQFNIPSWNTLVHFPRTLYILKLLSNYHRSSKENWKSWNLVFRNHSVTGSIYSMNISLRNNQKNFLQKSHYQKCFSHK